MKHDDRPEDERAAELRERASNATEAHEGNRVTADMETPQPTREPTRDRQKQSAPGGVDNAATGMEQQT